MYNFDGVSRRVIRRIGRSRIENAAGFGTGLTARRHPSSRVRVTKGLLSGRFAGRASLRGGLTDEYLVRLLILQWHHVTTMVYEKFALIRLHHDKCYHGAVIPVELQHGRAIGKATLSRSYPALGFLTFVVCMKSPVLFQNQPHEPLGHRAADAVLDAGLQSPGSCKLT